MAAVSVVNLILISGAEDAVRATDPSRGQKTKHHDQNKTRPNRTDIAGGELSLLDVFLGLFLGSLSSSTAADRLGNATFVLYSFRPLISGRSA